MTRSGKMAGVLALLAALLVGSPAAAQNSDTYRKDVRDRIDELRRVVDQVKQRYNLDREELLRELRRISEQVDRLQRTVDGLSSSTASRTSRFFDPDPRLAVGTGTIRLVNDLAEPVAVDIDGTRYLVPAVSQRLISQPAGSVSYRVRRLSSGYGPSTLTTVRANETLRITIH
jgi:hypothetical protein